MATSYPHSPYYTHPQDETFLPDYVMYGTPVACDETLTY